MSEEQTRGRALTSWLLPAGLSGPIYIPDHASNLRDWNWDGPLVTDSKDIESAEIVGAILSNGRYPRLDPILQQLPEEAFILDLAPGHHSRSNSRTWGIFTVGSKGLHLVDLGDRKSLESCRRSLWKRFRFLPLFLIKRRVTPVATLQSSNQLATRLDAAIDRMQNHLGRSETASPGIPTFQDKGKLTIPFHDANRTTCFLKLPLTARTLSDLDNAHRVLDDMSSQLSGGHPLQKIIPKIHLRFEIDGRPGWLEQALPGTPLSKIKDRREQEHLLLLAAQILGSMKTLAAPAYPNEQSKSRNVFLMATADKTSNESARSLARAIEFLDTQGPLYVRKGDMSLSNVLVEDGRISGLIDWDESGSTRHPAVNLADLLFSWSWQNEHLPRADAIDLFLGEQPPTLPSGLSTSRLLVAAGIDFKQFTFGVVESCLDHAYHELKHGQIGVRRMRVQNLLIDPLKAIKSHIPN